MRPCLACGYDLSGHGDEPRCPECGLLNIPEGYRRQVWELVDSGRWFFSGPFTFWRKRPPGWWWALDRPDDLRRAFVVMARNMCLASLVITASVFVASGMVVEETTHYKSWESSDPNRTTVFECDAVYFYGWGGLTGIAPYKDAEWSQISTPTRQYTGTIRSRVIWLLHWSDLPVAGACVLWLFFLWAGPALVGLVTQLRKGLPPFARPPRTIIAASCYESHRFVFISIAISLALGVYSVVLLLLARSPNADFYTILDRVSMSLSGFILLMGAAGWIGPLRSDYTRQLIRSRFHAARIVVMYAILLPSVIPFAIVTLLVATF